MDVRVDESKKTPDSCEANIKKGALARAPLLFFVSL